MRADMCVFACTVLSPISFFAQVVLPPASPTRLRRGEGASSPAPPTCIARVMAPKKVMKARLKVRRAAPKQVVDLTGSPSPKKRAAMKKASGSPSPMKSGRRGTKPRTNAKANGKGPSAAASGMRAFLASEREESSASGSVVAVDDDGKPIRRCRNKMAQFEKHRKTGVITPERYNAWKAQSRSEQTKIIDEMITYENGQYRINLKSRRYEEAFKRWERKEKGIVNQGVLLEEAETRAGGPEKLHRGIDAGRIQVDIIILHVSTSSS